MRAQSLLICGLMALAACGTPLERCERDVTRDLRVLNGLIADTQRNISRGYGTETRTSVRYRYVPCYYKDGRTRFCNRSYTTTREVPVAIDLETERNKLDSMLEKRAQLESEAREGIRDCRARFPGDPALERDT